MNMILLKEPPANAWTYVNPPDSIMDDHALEHWIRAIIKQGGNGFHLRGPYAQFSGDERWGVGHGRVGKHVVPSTHEGARR